MEALKLLAVLVVVLVLVVRRVELGLVMVSASALLVVLFGMTPAAIAAALTRTATTWTTWQLAIALAAIIVLEHALREWGALARVTRGLAGLVRDERIVMAALPALIGFLPSAGGARFSAPLVDEAAAGTSASPRMRSYFNYWFRHVWNYSVPVYAGVVLASAVAAVPVSRVIAANLPLTGAALAAGAVLGFPSVRAIERSRDGRGLRAQLTDLVPALLPIVGVLVAVLFLQVDIALAMVAATLAVVLVARVPARDVGRLLRSKVMLRTVGMVVGVLLFKDVLEASGAARALVQAAVGTGVPLLGVAFALPFAIGFVAALETAFVGLAFPLILAMAGAPDLGLLAFAYAAGFAGVMLSPLHLCMVFTREYFETEYLPLLAPVALSCALVLAVGLLLFIA